jgi:isopentenyl-diphosphate delta-isomerase
MSSEKLEVYTTDGKPTGIAKLRSQVHKDGDWHKTIHVWIAQPDGQVLIQRRSKQKTEYPYLWDASSAGHVSFGETSKEAGSCNVKMITCDSNEGMF